MIELLARSIDEHLISMVPRLSCDKHIIEIKFDSSASRDEVVLREESQVLMTTITGALKKHGYTTEVPEDPNHFGGRDGKIWLQRVIADPPTAKTRTQLETDFDASFQEASIALHNHRSQKIRAALTIQLGAVLPPAEQTLLADELLRCLGLGRFGPRKE